MREQWQTMRPALHSYGRLVRLLWQTNPRYTVMIVGLTIVSSLAAPAQIRIPSPLQQGIEFRNVSFRYPGYDLTIKENIGFGQVEYLAEMARIIQAADKGGAIPVVQKLANGYDTVLGRTFEDGTDLSGGEWQKLALSRAFMREAQILILDEPTAALDALAEYDVYQRFAELTTGKTTIFISHRFSTVRMAQQILVLADGQLIEAGSHPELMAQQGQYAKMFTAQAERYQ